MATPTRTLGRSGIEVSALGLGCWAIGGPWTFLGSPGGWSQVDDAESTVAIRRALDLGVTFFDTAANYGAGHSEEVLGRALAHRRADIVLATKFGYQVDEQAAAVAPYDGNEENGDVARRVRADLQASLRRLGTDYLDVYQLHVGGLALDRAREVRDVLESLVAEGSIRTYGWSTGRVDAMRAFADGPSCGVVQHGLSVLDRDDEGMLRLCHELNLGSINRSPLGMGLLTGKFAADTRFAEDDVRGSAAWHAGFQSGRPSTAYLDRLAAVRDVLTSSGRTLAQGALAWIWGRSPLTVPIPGFKTVAQVEDNCGALDKGPLSVDQMAQVDEILGLPELAAG
jgi:aryl-alcohol dehydrogenase-like predicted oxidoreductase